MRSNQYQQFWKAVKIAAAVEIPLFLGLFYRSEILRTGPHDGPTWLLLYPQFIGWTVASMLTTGLPIPASVAESLAWVIIFVVQMGCYVLAIWGVLLLARRNSGQIDSS